MLDLIAVDYFNYNPNTAEGKRAIVWEHGRHAVYSNIALDYVLLVRKNLEDAANLLQAMFDERKLEHEQQQDSQNINQL